MNRQIYIHKNDIHCTLTTFLYCNFWQMWAADKLGLDAYIQWVKGLFVQSYDDEKKYKEIPNAYEWYFEQPRINKPFDRAACEIWTWEFQNWGATQDITPYHFMAQPLHIIKDYYQKHLHFNDETNRRGQELVNKYNIDFNNTIGITWRGTDAKTDGRIRLPIEVYFRFIDEILSRHPDARIMCTAEEQHILDPLLNRYPSAFKIDEFYQSPLGHGSNPERFSPMSGYERGLQPVLMVWLFRKCRWYIKNRSSTGAVASWLSNGKIYNIAHEETLSYAKCDDQVEIEGVKYPLYL